MLVNARWVRMPRLAASMMLVAALAFAFHAGVVAAAFGGSAQASATALHGHDQGLASHDHAKGHQGHAQVAGAAHAQIAQSQHHDGKGHCKTNCCGAACTMMVLSTPAFQVSRLEVSSVLTGLFVPELSGIDASGLKRPPRTPSIA